MTHGRMMEDAKIQKAIDEIGGAIEVVRTTAKKVTKAELKLQKRLKLESLPAEIRWESDFAGEVWIGKEYREFWVQDPYENPIINLVTSNGTVILSAWESTKDNAFMRAAVREFHELIASRGDTSLIENRLMTIAVQFSGSKKRADWYTQSAEGLVLADGKKMEKKFCSIYLVRLQKFEDFNLSLGTAYKNAQYFARLYPTKYDYVEGFALANNRLFYHAWLQNKADGNAIDVTLYDINQLLGVPLDIEWVDKILSSRLKNNLISPRFTQSIIEGNFLDDFALLKIGVTPTW